VLSRLVKGSRENAAAVVKCENESEEAKTERVDGPDGPK
jgi:hypothetical protein